MNAAELENLVSWYRQQTGAVTVNNAYPVNWQQVNANCVFQSYVTSNTAATTQMFYQTNAVTNANTNIWYQFNAVTPYVQQYTAEQLAQFEQERRDREAKEKARRARAKELLHTVLTVEQKEQMEKDGTFILSVSERTYRIKPGHRVERLNEKSEIESYFCIHPELTHDLPPEDVAISQKLWLETNEAEFLKVANETKACRPTVEAQGVQSAA